jgi:hypothetical protein
LLARGPALKYAAGIALLLILAGLLITRPHVERYYAYVKCVKGVGDCWDARPRTPKNWLEVNEFPDYRSCNKATDEDVNEDWKEGKTYIISFCFERYRLDWGYRD